LREIEPKKLEKTRIIKSVSKKRRSKERNILDYLQKKIKAGAEKLQFTKKPVFTKPRRSLDQIRNKSAPKRKLA
jgi:hypothetical protein